MKIFRAFLLCGVIAGACAVAGCATAKDGNPSQSPVSGMKGIEQKPVAENTGWGDTIGWFFLESLYATAVANQSN